jgi:chitodextrinase
LASSDALSGIAGYTVYRNGLAIGQVTTASYTDSSTVAGTTYEYTVSAFDAAGNASAVSGKVSVTAGSGKPGKK